MPNRKRLLAEITAVEDELQEPIGIHEIIVKFKEPRFITERSRVTVLDGRWKDRSIYKTLSVKVIRDGDDEYFEAKLERTDW